MSKKLAASTQHSLLVRTITALVIAAIGIPLATFGGWFLLGLSFVLVGFAAYEILSLPGLKRYNISIWVLTYVAIYALVYWQFFKYKESPDGFLLFQGNNFYLKGFNVSIIAITSYLGLLFVASFFWKNFWVEDIFYLFSIALLVSLGFYSILFLRYFPIALDQKNPVKVYELWNLKIPDPASSILLWTVFSGVWASDTGAYLTGITFGKHLMNPRISPNKTWEGFIGGTLLSITVVFLMATIFAFSGLKLLPVGALSSYTDLFYWCWVLLLAVLIPIFDNVGGFMFSAIKRKYGAKDWGTILPGHGGIIDRFDGILVTSTAVSILIALFFDTGNFIA